jgi:hypothetical protein
MELLNFNFFRKKKQNDDALESLKQKSDIELIERMMMLDGCLHNPNGTDQDEMPTGYGEFGLEVTNPIPTRGIPGSRAYMNNLRFADGTCIRCDRWGSMGAPNIQSIIDAYRIFPSEEQSYWGLYCYNEEPIATIYICPYNNKNSTKAPKGFILVKN